MNSFSYLIGEEILISCQILLKHKYINGYKILKNAYILMELYQITHFHDLYVKKVNFQKLKFLDPRRNSYFSYFSGIFVLFSTEISLSGAEITIPIINHLLELANCFPTIYEQIL